ncbi:MAG: putative dehydrogenase/NAD(P)H nitroreductase, partial [Nitrososphaeraceae archaeon]|nr:putative dehydrogenase/NAD(P)H nitroreductase [Nitrososphaeraceae archaeon]
MEFDQVVRKRKMIREYLSDKQIPKEIITKLINNAHRAPSAGHSQVQEFIIIKDSITKKRLREAAVNQE